MKTFVTILMALGIVAIAGAFGAVASLLLPEPGSYVVAAVGGYFIGQIGFMLVLMARY